MAAYNDRVPLKDGTVLHTTDGKRFHILHSTSVGGSAILYSAHLDGSSLDVTLKEFYPAGCVRTNGVALNPDLAASDASPALRQAFYQRLERMAQHELELSQLAYNGSFHALPHLEQLEVCSISQPEEPVHRSVDGTALPCTFLYLPTLNPSKGFFLSDLLAECAAYPQSEEHPFGALLPDEPHSIAAPHILTTLHLIRLILDALATLHKTAIHGDISLGNLFIDGDLHTGTLRGAVFLDFGSARLLDAPNGKTAPILPSEKLYTTPLFCAPEIFTGVRSGEPFCLTPAADMYSVGVLLRLLLRKEALAAYRKFPEDLAEELKPTEIYPSDTVPSARPVLPQLNSILAAAAEPDPEKRIPVAEMLKEINDLIEQLSAPRFPLAENLSSPETFIPHSRDNELKAIRKQMDSGVRPIFLYSLGGLGKTETARALLRQCKKDGMRVAFFNYEHSVRNTILNLEFANYKYTPSKPSLTLEQQEEEHYCENLKLLAAMGADSVVVMDNFDSNSQTFDDLRHEPAYQDLIALGGPHLIITTRFTPKGNPPVEIKPLPKELLLKMMLNIMDEKDDSPSVDTLLNIIEAVQGHTLTCYLIGNALSDPLGDLTAQDVLDALKQYDLHSLTEDVTSDKDRKYTRETIYGHLKILFNMCGMTNAYRAALCHTLLLPQKGLDVKLFRQGESKEEQNALRSLIAHGWVQCTCSTENIHLLTIHPLIRELVANELKPSEADYSRFLQLLLNPDFFSLLEENASALRRLDLAQSILSVPLLSATPELAHACCVTGFHDFKRGRRLESIHFYDNGLSIYQQLSRSAPQYLYQYATECGQIGFLMSATNEYQFRSAELLRQAVAIWKQLNLTASGQYQVEYANACDNLGYQLSLSHDKVSHQESENILREALAIRLKLYQQDPAHYQRDYAWTADNLGKVLTRDCQSFAEAEKLLRTSLNIRESLNRASNGKNTSEIAWTCHNLGKLLATKPEHWFEAEQQYRKSIYLRQELDRLNPGTHAADASWTMLKLADLLAKNPARRTETKELYRSVLEIQQKIEKDHPGMFVLDANRVRRQYAEYLRSLPNRTPEEETELSFL